MTESKKARPPYLRRVPGGRLLKARSTWRHGALRPRFRVINGNKTDKTA